jgi:uncharacterized integral membrane protein
MSFKLLLRTLVFLAMLFVVLYAGMHNTQEIEFSFPMAFQKSIHAPAGMMYFIMFAVGVLAGTMLHNGGGRKGGGGKEK